jgi:hypothetical protein
MGRIVANVKLENVLDRSKVFEFSGMVDTGATYITLPKAWRSRLGEIATTHKVEFETATQQISQGELCGPILVEIEGFLPVHCDVLFIDMEPSDGRYEALIGYIPLEQCQAAVDMLGHRLIKAKAYDLKGLKRN